jgi:MSHA biogenesis protein MshN
VRGRLECGTCSRWVVSVGMSLINQLLQDLEKRHASGVGVKKLSASVRPLPPSSRRRVHLLAAGGLLATTAAAALLFSPALMESRSSFSTDHTLPMAKPQPAVAEETPTRSLAVLTAIPSEPVSAELAMPVFQMVDELERLPQAASGPKPAARSGRKRENEGGPKTKEASRVASAAQTERNASHSDFVPQISPAPEPPIEHVTIPDSQNITGVGKQMREPTTHERAEIEFRHGVTRLRAGRVSDAEAQFREALRQDASHSAARQALISLLVDAKRYADTEAVLRETLSANPRQPKHAMLLARLQLEREDVTAAVTTLESVKSYAGADPEYLAFLAAAYQRAGRHQDAVEAYRSALTLAPGNAVWLIGAGISLQALNERESAREMFRAAADSRTLTKELQAFADLRLRELTPGKR